MPANRFLSDDFGPPLPPADSDRRTRRKSSDSRDGRNRKHRRRSSRSRSSSHDRSSRSSRRRRSRSSSRDRRRSSGSSSRRRNRDSRSSSRDRHSRSRESRDRDTRNRRESRKRSVPKEKITITTSANSKDLDMRSVNMKPNAESTPRVSKTKSVALSDPFADESFDAFDSFGGGNLSRQRKDSDTRRKNRPNNDSDTRKIALSTNPLAGEFKPAERMRKPPTEEVANLSAPSLTLLCDPYPKKDTDQETQPKEIPITSDSSVDSTSSASRTTPKDVPNIELPNTFDTNDYDSGEDDYDPANCAFSDHESDDNPTNPLARALNAFKEAPTSNRSSSSSMVMSPVTPPTEDEGSGALKIDSGSVTDISPKPMSDSGSHKPQAVVPPQKPAPPPMQSLLTSQLSQPSSSLFAPLQMPSRQPPLMSPSGGITRSDSKAGLLSALQNSSSIENQPLLNIVQNLSEIKNQLNLNKSLHDMIAQQDKEDKKMKKSKKTSSGREVFKKRKDFQRAVVNCSKESIKPFYKSRRIDKDQYKKIMKECVSKIVHSSKSYTLDKAKVAHTIEKYVNKYSKKSRF